MHGFDRQIQGQAIFILLLVSNIVSLPLLVWIPATARTVGHLNKSAEVMKLVNNLMKAPEVAVTMQEFSKEMTKVCHPSYLSYIFFFSPVMIVTRDLVGNSSS